MVAFYPLSNGQFSTVPSMSSDFVNGKYTLNNAASTFDAIWDKIFSNDDPVYLRPENVSVQQGKGLVLSYKYIPLTSEVRKCSPIAINFISHPLEFGFGRLPLDDAGRLQYVHGRPDLWLAKRCGF